MLLSFSLLFLDVETVTGAIRAVTRAKGGEIREITSAEAGGEIIGVLAERGDSVTSGTPTVCIDARDMIEGGIEGEFKGDVVVDFGGLVGELAREWVWEY